MIEVTNRDYQLRGVDQQRRSSTSWSILVVGRAPDGTPVQLKDVGYLQVGYDQRRSTVDLDGTGEVVGGIAIMEQDQNVLAITRALEQKLQQIAARRCRRASRSSPPTIARRGSGRRCGSSSRRSASSSVVLIVVTLLFLRNVRTAVGPIAILLLSVLFTVLPLVGFSQTINLFSLAGLCHRHRRDRRRDDRHRRELHGGAVAARRASAAPRSSEILIRSIASRRQAAAVLAADHPRVVPAGVLPRGARSAPVRSAGLQQDVRDGVLDAADALPAADRSCVWIFKREQRSRGATFRRARRSRAYRSALSDRDPLPLRVHDRRAARADPCGACC